MTRADAITAAGLALADGYRTLDGLDGSTVEQAARAAWTPSGPSLSELTARIADRRGLTAAA